MFRGIKIVPHGTFKPRNPRNPSNNSNHIER
nr:MAG TPA: hypothetical protein [Caudoviricetes sp.]